MLAIIILNYNTWELTIKCVDSIYKTSKDYKVYIVDNNSPNNSFEILRREYKDNPEVEVLNTGENLGYAKGNNFGAKKAFQDGYKYILIANNDIIFKDNAINIMLSTLSEDIEIACVAPLIHSISGEIESLPTIRKVGALDYLLSFTRLSKIYKIFKAETPIDLKYKIDFRNTTGMTKIYKFSGCCFMIKSEVFKTLEMFDTNTFLYFEEDILCFKMFDKKYSSFFVPNAVVEHHHGKTTGKDNFFVDSEMLKSELYYFTKYQKMNFICLNYLYLDRIITPLIKKIRAKYKVSCKDYFKLICDTLRILIKGKVRTNKKTICRSNDATIF